MIFFPLSDSESNTALCQISWLNFPTNNYTSGQLGNLVEDAGLLLQKIRIAAEA